MEKRKGVEEWGESGSKAADVKIVWREIREEARKTESEEKEGEIVLKRSPTIAFVLLHASCSTDKWRCACIQVSVHVCLRTVKTGSYPQWLPAQPGTPAKLCLCFSAQLHRVEWLWLQVDNILYEPCTHAASHGHVLHRLFSMQLVCTDCVLMHLLTVAVMFLRQHASPSSAEQVERISIRKLNLLRRRLLSHESRLLHSRKEALNRFAFLSDYCWSNRDERRIRQNKPAWTLLRAG